MNKLKTNVFGALAICIMVVGILQGVNTDARETGTKTASISPNGMAGFSATLLDTAKDTNVNAGTINIEGNGSGGLLKASYEDARVTTGPAINTETKGMDVKKEDPKKEEEDDEPLVDVHKDSVNKTLYVSASSLNVRDKADKSGKVVKKLSQNAKVSVGQKITVYIDGAKQPVWYKLKGSDGYVAANYLSDKPKETADSSEGVLLGTYRITYYCSCAICCGRVSHTTASGAPTVEGVTIAADPSIPFGTKLKINGHVYTVQDRGGAIRGNHIDVYVSSHSKALSQTYTRGPVYKVK